LKLNKASGKNFLAQKAINMKKVLHWVFDCVTVKVQKSPDSLSTENLGGSDYDRLEIAYDSGNGAAAKLPQRPICL
jgi:hypothetical protein